jgi:hypothetical protein
LFRLATGDESRDGLREGPRELPYGWLSGPPRRWKVKVPGVFCGLPAPGLAGVVEPSRLWSGVCGDLISPLLLLCSRSALQSQRSALESRRCDTLAAGGRRAARLCAPGGASAAKTLPAAVLHFCC